MSDEYKLQVKLEEGHPRFSAWIGILMDDTFRLETCEWDSEIYGDHATFYDVLAKDKPSLLQALSDHVGQSIVNDEVLLSTLASAFQYSGSIRDWLRQVGMPLKEHWAYV